MDANSNSKDQENNFDNNVLIAEDDSVTATVLTKYLEQKGYNVTTAVNGRQAIEIFQTKPAPVVITDIYMPELDGRELISLLQKSTDAPVIIAISSETEINTVLDILRQGVYDYLVKPINKDELAYKIEKAFEISQIRKTSRAMMKEREMLHSQKIDWNSWKDALLRRDSAKLDQNLFANIKTSFSQSGGFGGILSLIPLLSSQESEDKSSYLVNKEIVDLLKAQAKTAYRTFEQFDAISDIIRNRFKLSPINLMDIYDILKSEETQLIDMCAINSNIIQFSESKFNKETLSLEFYVEPEYLRIAFRELLLNALRYSESGSKVLVVMDHDKKYLHISILNTPNTNQFGSIGVPEGYEKLVFEPFFRLHATVDERYKTLDIGIGLTLVDRIIRKLNGSIVVRNVTDHSDLTKGPQIKVQFDIRLPVA